jgi:GntR family transcriptional regulator/MocR family aminotransferase
MTQELGLLFTIDRSRKTPIFEQLCEVIRKLARTGTLKQGTRLPATRVLAEDLAVSRSTVVTAYEQLVAEGYLEGRRGAGYIACSIGAVELPDIKNSDNIPALEVVPSVMPFTPSHPDMRLFPYRHWAKNVARVCRTNPQAMLTGASSFGNLALRQMIANHVSEWRGLEVTPQQVIVTTGATEALNICFRTLTEKGQVVGIEDPGYKPILRFVISQGLTPVFLDIDKYGATVPEKQAKPHVVVLTPSHQYPLGGVMSPQRRWEYINWANTNNSWIIEDDYDSEFRYSGRPIPAMASFDKLNRTIYIGSFSKIFSNTLRLGYIIAPSSLIVPIRDTMDNYGLKAGLMPQQPLSEFIDSGDFYRHLRRVRKIYNERRKFLVHELAKNFSHFGKVQDHPAGMQLIFHLDKTLKDTEIAQRAKNIGIALEPLSESTMRNLDYNGFILGFCGYSQDEMSTALKRLHTLLST